MGWAEFRGYRVILEIEAGSPFTDYTGIITKTLVYTLAPELFMLRGVKGVLSPLAISPPFKVEGSHGLGEPVIPRFVRSDPEGKERLVPVELGGEYVFHVGGERGVVEYVVSRLSSLRERLAVKVKEAIIHYKLEAIHDVTKEAHEKAETLEPGSKVTLHLASPAQIFNVYTPSKMLKFTPSAVEILMVPYALTMGTPTITEQVVLSSFPVLGSLVETWYSLRTLRPVRVPFRGKPQMLLEGKITYIVDPKNRSLIPRVQSVIASAEILGVGRSRQNGFGTVKIQL